MIHIAAPPGQFGFELSGSQCSFCASSTTGATRVRRIFIGAPFRSENSQLSRSSAGILRTQFAKNIVNPDAFLLHRCSVWKQTVSKNYGQRWNGPGWTTRSRRPKGETPRENIAGSCWRSSGNWSFPPGENISETCWSARDRLPGPRVSPCYGAPPKGPCQAVRSDGLPPVRSWPRSSHPGSAWLTRPT